jgi:hypothetical protein
MREIVLVVSIIIILAYFVDKKRGPKSKAVRYPLQEHFVSGREGVLGKYDQILPLDDPKYMTPQQRDFQMVLSEHSALDPNMQNQRKEMQTQKCRLGEKCFDTLEYHELNFKTKSAPNIISSKIGYEEKPQSCTRYLKNEQATVLPANAANNEMRADLFTDIVLPDLFFEHRRDAKCPAN